MKRTAICLAWMVLAIPPSCANSTNRYPKMECESNYVPDRAAFCSKTIAMNFGPADQFVGYSVVEGQAVCIMNKEKAQSLFPVEIEHTRTFIKDIKEIISSQEALSYDSGIQGENSFAIDPGNYVICTQSKQDHAADQPILSCEPKYLKMNHRYRLLIIDNPRAGIRFEWK